MRKQIVTLSVILFAGIVIGQDIKRQTIGSFGTYSDVENIYVQQLVGQPYQSAIKSNDNLEIREGFIQPLTLQIEFLQSSIPVKVNVYPNPAVESVQFSSDKELKGLIIHAYDQAGKQVYSDKVENLQGYQLNCSGWNNGAYILRLEDSDMNVHTTKLLITK